MGRVVGIDLGTTNTAIACLRIGGTEVIPNREGEYLTKSIVGSYKGEIQVGRIPFNRWQLAPQDTIVSVKRLMGRSFDDEAVRKLMSRYHYYRIVPAEDGSTQSLRVVMEGRLFSPIDISSFILRKVKQDAEERLGEEVTHCVITVPAYFSDRQRQATREAGMRAGFKVMRLLDEPVAAAIAYGIQNPTADPKTVLVYDLGGGTFDVTIIVSAEGKFVELVKEGDMWLGGDDFDQALFEFVLDQSEPELRNAVKQDTRTAIELRKACQAAKEALSSSQVTEIIVPACGRRPDGNLIDVVVEVTRKQFEQITEHLVNRTLFLIERALTNAHLEPDDIDWVVLVGSASSMPHIHEKLRLIFGDKKIKTGIHPKHCVAIGAAIAAAQLNSIMCPNCNLLNSLEADNCESCGTALANKSALPCPSCGILNEPENEKCNACGNFLFDTDSFTGGITGFYYGIVTDGNAFQVYVNKGEAYETPLEKRIYRTFYTRFDRQAFIAIPVCRADERSGNSLEPVGEAIALLPLGATAGTPVKVGLWLNGDGYFELEAGLENGSRLPVSILRWSKTDGKIMKMLEECAASAADPKLNLTTVQRNELLEYQVQILKELEKDKVYNAERLVDEMAQFINRHKPDASLEARIEGICGFAEYLAHEYSWLVGMENAYRLSSEAKGLRSSLGKARKCDLELDLIELEAFLMNLFYEQDETGCSYPTFLGWLIESKAIINRDIASQNPALAHQLRKELAEIESAAKHGRPDFELRFKNFHEKLGREYEKIVEAGSGIAWKCPNCGNPNAVGSRRCAYCGTDLWLLVSM